MAPRHERAQERETPVTTMRSMMIGCLALAAVAATAPAVSAQALSGQASWYGPGFHGRTTASGEAFNMHALTAAHPTLPFGTRVRVTNERTGASVVVRINDRGPHVRGRIIDLSREAAGEIGMLRSGVAPVRIEVLGRA